MKPILACGVLAVFTVLLGCGQQPAPVPPVATRPSTTTALDDKVAYQTLAKHLADNWTKDRNAPKPNKDLAQILVEGENLILDFKAIKSTDPELVSIREKGRAAAHEAMDALRLLDQLPRPPGYLEHFLDCFACGLAYRPDLGHERMLQAEAKGDAIQVQVRRILASMREAEVAKLLLRRAAQKFAGPALNRPNAVLIDVDESFGADPDWVALTNNAGRDLHNVLVSVTLAGKGGETKENIHFVPKWRANDMIHGRYEAGAMIGDKVVGRQSVVLIQTVQASVTSDEGQQHDIVYQYAGAEKEKDVQRMLDALKIDLSYKPFKRGVFVDDPPAVLISFAGQEILSKVNVTITLYQHQGIGRGPRQQKSIELANWRTGNVQRIEFPGLAWTPVEYYVHLSLSGYGAQTSRKFT